MRFNLAQHWRRSACLWKLILPAIVIGLLLGPAEGRDAGAEPGRSPSSHHHGWIRQRRRRRRGYRVWDFVTYPRENESPPAVWSDPELLANPYKDVASGGGTTTEIGATPSSSTTPGTVPIIITNFNMLHFLRWKVSNLLEHGFRNIHIIDNNSSYVPLREYYYLSLQAAPAPKDLPAASVDLFTLHRMPTNRGAYALWKVPGLVQSIDLVGKRFVLTDVDVIYPRFPHGFSWLPTFNALLDRFPGLVKVGHALELNDLEQKELGYRSDAGAQVDDGGLEVPDGAGGLELRKKRTPTSTKNQAEQAGANATHLVRLVNNMERSHWAVRVGLHADNGTLKLTATPEESEVDLLADTSGAARAKRRARYLSRGWKWLLPKRNSYDPRDQLRLPPRSRAAAQEVLAGDEQERIISPPLEKNDRWSQSGEEQLRLARALTEDGARGLETTSSTDKHFTVYAAALDTSGGLYRENCALFHPWWVRGVRYSLRVAGKNFTAHHLPWYLDHENKDIWPPDYAAAMRDKLSISAGGGTYSARMPNDETENKKGTVMKT